MRRSPLSILPSSATRDARLLVAARSLRSFGDGLTSVLLPFYLLALGHSQLEVGVLATAALLGSAVLTLGVGLVSHRIAPRGVLLAASALMLATGLGFAAASAFVLLLVIAFVGTLNPSGGDVSVFLPTEQALLTETVVASERTALFARYNVCAALAVSLGALSAGLPAWLAARTGTDLAHAARFAFAGYGLLGVAAAGCYRRLARAQREPASVSSAPRRALEESRGIVLRLTALFSLDSFGGGFAINSILVLWLRERHALSLETAGVVMSAAALLSALSQLLSAPLARRIGLIRTMVFTHLPANAFLIGAAFAPSAGAAIACLLARAALSQMDVPARQAYVMSVVKPEERAAAASFTNVPRSLASALSPTPAGALLGASSFGWPLVVGGALKIVYDLLLLAGFRHRPPRV
ncbi:MAG TPA: MFS transporter [Myxococcota bacterium]|nr:MFS transporter [Myxococcota bacterium]